MSGFIYKEESYAIHGALFAVHRELGVGFLERVYQDALEYELRERGIPYEREKKIQIMYKGKPLGEPYRADFVCYDKIHTLVKVRFWDNHNRNTVNHSYLSLHKHIL